jgi:VanZ family protein
MSRVIWLGAAVFSIFIGAVIVAANLGVDHPGHALVRWLPMGDKIGHAVLFGGLALIINLALGCHRVSVGRLSVLTGSALVTAFVAIEELSQRYVSNRTLDVTDFAADLVGIALASLVAPRLHQLVRHSKAGLTGP